MIIAFLGKDNAKQYWEMLLDQQEAYEEAEALWQQIEPLYKKLHNFVKIRLDQFYNITKNDTEIPVFLLGK